VRTVVEAGWSGVKNGRLLALAADEFDAFITVDKNLPFQQNLAVLPIALLVLDSVSNETVCAAAFGAGAITGAVIAETQDVCPSQAGLTIGSSDHGVASSVDQGRESMIWINQLRWPATQPRVAQPHR
jgi:hypothetical protein